MGLKWTGVLAAALVLATAGGAQAIPSIHFDNNVANLPAGGTLAYDGAGGALVGTDIGLEFVQSLNTPLNPGGVLLCDGGCLLNFTTGNNLTEGPVYTWGGGGSFTITGKLVDPNNGNAVVANGTLLQGTWNSPVAGVQGTNQLVVAGGGTDTKIAELLDFYGVTALNWIFSNTDISATGTFGTDGSFSLGVFNADVSNTVPEPGTLLLLGSGLLGAGLMRRRMNRK